MRLTRFLSVMGIFVATALVAVALLARGAGPASATGAGMALSGPGPAPVPVSGTFTISVNASPAPGVDVGSFTSEVVFPVGLTWVQRANCVDEVLATAAGNPPMICLSSAGPSGEARHMVTSGFLPPLPAFDTPIAALLELDVRCDSPGSHTIVLTAVPGSSFGAIYWDTLLTPIPVKTVPYDVDGDTIPENVASTVTVDCAALPTWTPTVTLTSTPTLTPTATPSPTSTATPTATPTPTMQPASDTDGDGCMDAAESGPDETQGGQRDYLNFWDFFDVPTGAGLSRDGSIASEDIFAVLGRFNATDSGPGDFDRNDNPLSTPNQHAEGADRANYHPAYDRGALVGPNAWNLGPPDGAIASIEVFAVIAQFNHSCS